jgi:GNAT superfamily N-acetyltransferase
MSVKIVVDEIPDGVEVPMAHRADDSEDPETGGKREDSDWEEDEYNYRLNNSNTIFYAIKDNVVIGHLGLDSDDSVQGVYVDPEHRGEGIAIQLYLKAVDTLGSIESDTSSQEQSGKDIWKKLKQMKPDNVFLGKKTYKFSKEPIAIKKKEESEDPKKLYHVTSRRNLPSILKRGLIPSVGEITTMGHSADAPKMVFLIEDPAGPLRGLGHKDAIALEVDVTHNTIYHFDGYGIQELGGKYYDPASTGPEEMEIPPVGVEDGDFFTFETIEPKYIKISEGFKSMKAKCEDCKDCDCEEHDDVICSDCGEHSEYCPEHGTECCGAKPKFSDYEPHESKVNILLNILKRAQ